MSSNCCSRLLAIALCGALLAGCDAVKDVREEPYSAVPPKTQLIAGTVEGLGTVRPVVLSYDGAQDCKAPDASGTLVPSDCKFFGSKGQSVSTFSFGSADTNGVPFTVGKPYTITVVKQPFGKLCTVANATGTVGGTGPAPVVTCVTNPAVARFSLTVTIPLALQTTPLNINVATEDGEFSQAALGVPSVVFPGVLFNSQSDLPAFEYKVTATTDKVVGGVTTRYVCSFAQQNGAASFNQGGRNRNPLASADTPVALVDDSVVVPTASANVSVAACSFPVSATVQYVGTPAAAMGAGGVTLALRNHFTGVVAQTLNVAAFTTGTITVTFPDLLMANSQALYELVVTQHPAGQRCVVFGTTVTNADTTSQTAASAGGAVNINAPTAGAVMLIDPDNTDWWTTTARSVRCAAVPAAPNVLVGTYQMDAQAGNQTTTTTTNGVSVTTEVVPARLWGRPSEFLTFFDDGTFLYGINANTASTAANSPNSDFPAAAAVRNNWAANSGVNHGFYVYNSTAGTITFTVVTATDLNNNSGATAATTTTTIRRGLIGMPTYVATTGVVQATSVVKGTRGGLGTLSLTFTNTSGRRIWTMTEPKQIPGELTGAWVTADHLRSYVYDKDYTYAFHMGVNGMGNMQNTCLLATDDSSQASGLLTKHAGSATATTADGTIFTCTPGLLTVGTAGQSSRNLDAPHYAPKNSGGGNPSQGIGPTTPRIVPGFHGRFPGMNSQLDNRPNSPVQFQVVAGVPDTLNVQNTLNGVPIEDQLVFRRIRPN
jgi:hypothetical protein